jgi:hypothetical protein
MKICVMTVLLFLSSVITANTLQDNILGHWVCEPYKKYLTDTVYFNVEIDSYFYDDGTGFDIQTWKYSVEEEQIWFSLKLTGPWKLKDGVLIETTYEESILDTSDRIKELPNFNVKEVFKSLNDTVYPLNSKSEILTLSKSAFISKKLSDGEIVSCVRGSNNG